MAQNYERLQDLKAGVSGRQGIFVYAPVAQQDRLGIVKGSDSITVNGDGSLHVSEAYKLTTIQVMNALPVDLAPYEGALLIVGETLYKVESGVANPATLEFSAVKAYRTGYSGAHVEYEDGVSVTIDINGAKHIFCDNQADSYFPFIYKRSEVDGMLASVNARVDDIENGDIPAGKAIADQDGRVIDNSYASKIRAMYYPSSRNLELKLHNPHDVYINNSTFILNIPLATPVFDGLMRAADKVKVDGIDTNIDTKIATHNSSNLAHDDIRTKITTDINTHDTSNTAHLYIRTLIANLQREVDRINAKGRSWGEVDKTYSELFAMSENDRNAYVLSFLQSAFVGYTNEVGNLVYTKVSDSEEEHELEYNGSTWVDNGAYIVGKASNTQMGIVKGDLTYVSILNGLIQVLKSDYATNIGESGSSYNYADLLQLFTNIANDLADRYTKAQTYSQAEVESRIMDLLALANLQDTAIQWTAGVYDLSYNGSVVSTFPSTLVSPYNWVFVRVLVGTQAEYTMFKPSVSTTGVGLIMPLTQKDVYASVKRVNGDYEFALYKKTDDTLSTTTAIMKAWGIKLDGINDEEIATSFTTANYLNGKVNQQEVNIELDKQIATKITDNILLQKSSNLFNYETAVDGYFVNQSNGELVANASHRASDYIEVEENEKYIVLYCDRYAFYNENKVYISGLTSNYTTPTILTAPSLAKYMRFSSSKPIANYPLTVYQVNKGEVVLPFEPFGKTIKPNFIKELKDNYISYNETDFVRIGKNLYDYTKVLDGYLINQGNGAMDINASYWATENYIIIVPNKNYCISGTSTTRVAFYDDAKRYISGIFPITTPFTSPSNAKYLRFSSYIAGNPKEKAQLEQGDTITSFSPFGYEFVKSSDVNSLSEEQELILPSKLYGLVGKELNVYYDNISKFDYKKYDFDVVSTIGQQRENRYFAIPTSDGTYALSIKAIENDVEKSVASTNIIVKTASVGSGITKKVIVIGDSTTANGVAITKLNENFSTDVMTIQTLGTKGTSPNNHEGISGWTASMFKSTATDGLGTNSFFNPSTSLFDFAYYMANSGVDVPDYVIINLGINDTFSYTSDLLLQTQMTNIKADYQFMIDSIKTYNANIKIGVAITIPPNYSQNAFGLSYGAGQTRRRYKRNNFLWTKELISYFDGKEAQGIYLVPINTNIDVFNNFPTTTETLNARNSTSVQTPSNGVHPADSGYHQVADVYWYWLKSFES